MGKTYDAIDENLQEFLAAQRVFFVASAPGGFRGHVNVSPKGLDTLRVIDGSTVAYLDFVGSGVETIAHARENGRIVLMVCAFEGPPKILRLWGQAATVEPGDGEFESLRTLFPEQPGVRAVVKVRVERISDSCGYAVPLYEFRGERTQLAAWASKKGPDGVEEYRNKKNAQSLDGLPGLRSVSPDPEPQGLSPATMRWRKQGRFVNAAGRSVFVVQQGSGPALLLLHGYPTSAYDWRRVMESLSGDHACIAPDLLGFGLTEKPEAASYSLFDQADLVEDLMRRLRVTRAHVVSHDMGTSVHTELLARKQEGRLAFTIECSTFLNGSMAQWLATITPFQELVAANATLQQAMAVCREIADVYVPGLRALMQRPEGIDVEDALVMRELLLHDNGNLRLPVIAGYMRERYLHADRWLGALAKEGSKVQLVWATGDPVANVALGRELARRCPAARYEELDGLGHFLLMEDPDRVAAAIRAFSV